jgi:hypothetical protein
MSEPTLQQPSQPRTPVASQPRAAAPTPPVRLPREPMMEPTPREERLAALAEKAKDIKPQLYDVTNKNEKATRVLHDCYGRAIAIPPGQTKQGIALKPHTAAYLRKGDIALTDAAETEQ